VDVKPQLLEVGGDDVRAAGVVVFVPERLRLHRVEVGGVGGFQFDDRHRLVVFEDGPVGLFAVRDVFEFRGEVVIRVRIKRITQDVDKQLAEESFLELLLLRLADVLLSRGVAEITLEGAVFVIHHPLVEAVDVFFYD